MIKAEQIPDEVVEAMLKEMGSFFSPKEALTAIAAALNAWPGIEIHTDGTEDWIELPLTQENNNGSD